MKKILEALGLDPKAGEDEAVAAILALKKAAAPAPTGEVKDVLAEKITKLAKSLLEKNKAKHFAHAVKLARLQIVGEE